MRSRLSLLPCAAMAIAALLTQARYAHAAGADHDDPEQSPLFSTAMEKAFAHFAALDCTPRPARPAGPGVLPPSAGPILVSGEHWYRLAPEPFLGPKAESVSYGTQQPSGTTFDGSPTCVATSCQIACPPTSHGGPTCAPNVSCTPSVTCASPTCGTIPTCSVPTCSDWPTCGPLPTFCSTTCMGTCDVTTCPAPYLWSVSVSNNPAVPGEHVVKFCFKASGTVQYIVQYTTNLNGLEWNNLLSKLGDDSTVAFVHSNAAPRALYRVVMQNP